MARYGLKVNIIVTKQESVLDYNKETIFEATPIIKYFHFQHTACKLADKIVEILQKVEWFLDVGIFEVKPEEWAPQAEKLTGLRLCQ